MVDVKIKIALGLIAILILAAPIAIAQEVPPHVVISEVQIATNEFVELYNPTNTAIDMAGWHWCYFSANRNWNNSVNDKTFPPGASIQAHGFYLIATTAGEFPTADWNLNYGGPLLSNTAGSVGIFPWDPDTNTAEDAKAGKIDAVGWGSVTYVYETATASTPGSGESIERKPLKEGYAPCQDTDDNSADFAVQGTPTPKNSASPKMDPAPVELFDKDDNLKGSFVKIQYAIDTASDEDTIRVDNGTYSENVVVDKQLTICSEFGADYTTIQAADPDDNAIDVINADNVKISGFNVAGATDKGGIHLDNADYCNIANNIVSNNNIGIHLQQGSRDNTITNNNVSDNGNGIWLASSGDNTITNNNVSNNNQNGIRLHISNNNRIYNNYFENTNNAVDDDNNIWNITKTVGPNIIGGPYLGGNYWSDYTGVDTNYDGLGDTLLPYNSSGNIESGGDIHPLVHEGAPGLSIEKSGEPDHMHPGGTINYTISVKNTGANATNVIVTKTYDANVTFISAAPAPSQDDNKWEFPTLNVSETKWINISVSVNPDTPSGSILHNRVDVTCDEGVSDSYTEDTVIEDACVQIDTVIIVGPACFRTNGGTIEDLEAVAAAPTPFPDGFKFPYGFFSFNITGLENGQTVIVTITLPVNAPEGTEYWKYHVSEGGWIRIPMGSDDGDNVITITLVDGGLGDDDCTVNGVIVDQGGPGGKPPEIIGFAPEMTTIYDPVGTCRTFNVTVDQTVNVFWYRNESLKLTNNSVREAKFSDIMHGEGVYNITASAENIYNRYDPDKQSWTWIVKPTNISVTKVADVTEVKPSTNVTFTITINNTGNTTLNRIVVEDQLRKGLNYSYADPGPDAITPGFDKYDNPVTNLTWYINRSFAVGQSETITLVANITEDATGVLKNRVDVTGWPDNGTNATAYDIAEVNVIKVEIKKSCTSSVSLGGTVTYTITYSNPGEANLTDVVIIEHYPDDLTFISADPAPDSGTNNKWTIGALPVGGSGKIKIKMKVPDTRSDLSYEESGSVAGEGIVIISKEMSTEQKPYELENIVTISGSCNETIVNATASAITTLGASGSSLELREHGSGIYESEEESSLSLKTGRIEFDKYTKAEYRPTTFNCSDGFVMEVTSKWSQDICIKNYAKTSAIRKTITEATALEDNTRIDTKNTGNTMDFDSTFSGYMHVDTRTISKPKEPKVAATSEHYIGNFVIKDWDEKGDKSVVEGVGYVIVDKELDTGRVLLMEHGSGSYSSEEDSTTTRIAKTTYAVYEPTSFNFSDSFVVNFSSKWMQDFCVKSSTTATKKNRGTRTLLHKKIRDATYIDDDTIAKRGSLKFDTFFYGATHIGSRSRYLRASEDYIGEFYISWGARTDCTFVFDWDDVPGADDDKLIRHLSEPKFHMPWVRDDDVVITKPVDNTINISTTGHSAEIILDTETNESAELIVDGVDTYTFEVVKHGDTLKVYDCELEKKPEEVIGEGFVMIDEAIFKGGEIQVTEHGSGIYHSYEDFGSTSIEKETYGVYKPTYFEFSDSFAVNFSSNWMQDVCAKDEAEGTAIHKKISDASFMKDDTIVAKRSLNFTSSFNGSMHIGARTGDIKISEDYIGEFDVTQLIKMVKGKRPTSSSKTSDWLSCPCPIPSSTYPWVLGQYPTPIHHWICPSIAP